MKRKTIDSYIANVIEESLKATLQKRALQEKEKQDVIADIGLKVDINISILNIIYHIMFKNTE